MIKRLFILILISIVLHIVGFQSTYAQSFFDIPYLIVDKTKTPWGHRFYKTFSEIWKAPSGISGYFIIVEEKKPTFRQSWIYVKVGDNIYMKPVYVNILKPTTSDFDMQKYAVEAAKRTIRFLLIDFERIKSLENKM